MPTLNLDEEKGVIDPIEVVLDGKKYTVNKITHAVMLKVDEVVKGFKEDEKPENGLAAQILAEYFGVKADEFKDVDERKLMRASTFVQETFTRQITGKENPTPAKVKK